MTMMTDAELTLLVDDLYDRSGDDDAELVMGFDRAKKLFFIGVWNGEKIIAAFAGEEAYDRAATYAREHCSA